MISKKIFGKSGRFKEVMQARLSGNVQKLYSDFANRIRCDEIPSTSECYEWDETRPIFRNRDFEGFTCTPEISNIKNARPLRFRIGTTDIFLPQRDQTEFARRFVLQERGVTEGF